MRPLAYALAIVLAVVIVIAALEALVSWSYRSAPQEPAHEAVSPETPPEYLSPHLRILMFYPTDTAAPLGRPQTVCYGVVNAEKVRLDPALAEVAPSINRCFSVTVDRPQMLTLTATGKEGQEAVAAFRLGVKAPRPVITSLQLSTFTPKRGETVTLCYGTKFASRVRLDPSGPDLAPAGRRCVEWIPGVAAYRIVAESKDGRDEAPLPLRIID